MSSEKSAESKPEHLAPLLAALGDLSAWLLAKKVPGAVIGGVAASLLGRPRLTRDVDAMVLLDEGKWEDFLAADSIEQADDRHRRRKQARKFSRRGFRVIGLDTQEHDLDLVEDFGQVG